MTTAVNRCQKLSMQLEQARDALHELMTTGSLRESQDGTSRTAWNTPNEATIKRRIREIETEYAQNNCAVVLNETPAQRVSRAPIYPRF